MDQCTPLADGIVAFEASITYGMLMIKQPKNHAVQPTLVIDFVIKSMEIPGGVYVEDAHFNIEVLVDASGAVAMRAGLNGTIGLGKSLPPVEPRRKCTKISRAGS